MYTVYLNGQYFGSSDSNDVKNKLIDPNVKVEVNKAGTFQCTITPFHEFYNRLIKMKSFVNVYQNGDHIFSGRLLYTEADSYGQMNCYFEGDLSYFIDTVQEPGVYKETPRQRFERFLETHNQQVDPEKHFYSGSIEIDEVDEEKEFKDTTYKDTKSMMDSLVDDYGGYLVVRHMGGFSYLDYLKEYDKHSTQKLRFRKNILDIQHYISGEDLFTVLLPLSTIPEPEDEEPSPASEEETEEDPYEEKIMTIESVNNGSKFIEIEELIDIFGRIIKIQTFDNAQSPEDLLNMGKRYIEDMVPGLTNNITITALDDSFIDDNQDPIRLGDLVEIFYEPLNLKKVMSCVSIDYDLANPENSVYRFGTLKQDLSGKYSSTVSVYNDYSKNNNSVIEYHNKIINHIEQDLIVNARNIEINAKQIQVNADKIEINAQDIVMNAQNIQLNADRIEMNAKEIVMNAEKIALIAEEILLYARKDYVDDINGRTIELEAYIKVLPGIIDMKASKTELQETADGLREMYRTAQIEIDGINAAIRLKAEAKDVTALETRVNSAEITIDGLNADIKLKASASSVTALETRMHSAEVDIDGLNASIKLKAEASSVTALETRMHSAEVDIDGLNASIKLKAEASTVTALEKRVNSAELTIDGLNSTIKAKADSLTVANLTTRVNNAELTINGLEGSIGLKANTTTVNALTNRVTTAEASIKVMSNDITLSVSRIDANDASIKELYKSEEGLWTATAAIPEYYAQKQELISLINISPESITIQAKRVNLVGYVTAQQLEAETARVDNFFNGYSMISTAYVNYINCQGSMSFKGTFLKWTDINIPTSISGPLFNYVTLQYVDHNGSNKSQVVLTSVNTAASLNKTKYTLLGAQ